MSRYHFLILIASLLPLNASSLEFMKDYFDYSEERPLPKINNDLVYGNGSSEITTQVNQYDKISANKPIQGSIFITHDAKNSVDASSFRLGNKPLKVTFVQNTQMSPGSVVVSIYSFQLEGMGAGIHTLPSINVKVGNKLIQALPLVIEVQGALPPEPRNPHQRAKGPLLCELSRSFYRIRYLWRIVTWKMKTEFSIKPLPVF